MAVNQLRELQKRKKQIEREIEQLQKALADIEKVEKMVTAAAQRHVPEVDAGPRAATGGRTRAGPKPVHIVAAVREILAGAVHPMTRSELIDALKDRDMEIQGANPANTLGTTLSRNTNIFVNLERFGYWLRARNYPDAGYFGHEEPDDDGFSAVH